MALRAKSTITGSRGCKRDVKADCVITESLLKLWYGLRGRKNLRPARPVVAVTARLGTERRTDVARRAVGKTAASRRYRPSATRRLCGAETPNRKPSPYRPQRPSRRCPLAKCDKAHSPTAPSCATQSSDRRVDWPNSRASVFAPRGWLFFVLGHACLCCSYKNHWHFFAPTNRLDTLLL